MGSTSSPANPAARLGNRQEKNMKTVTIDALTAADALRECRAQYGWTPDAIREVDSGSEDQRAWMCFESAQDAELWDRQT